MTPRLTAAVATLACLVGTTAAEARESVEPPTPCTYASPPDAFPTVDGLMAKRVSCKKARRVARKVQARPYKGTWNPPKRVRAGKVFRCSYRYVTIDFEMTHTRAVCKARGGRRVTMRLYS
jgi:hypothetical protein